MLSSDQVNILMKRILEQLEQGDSEKNGNIISQDIMETLAPLEKLPGQPGQPGQGGSDQNRAGIGGKGVLNLAPSQILVMAGLLTGVFNVQSVLIDRSHQVQIVLTGSLRRRTELERMMTRLGGMNFGDVMRAILGSFR